MANDAARLALQRIAQALRIPAHQLFDRDYGSQDSQYMRRAREECELLKVFGEIVEPKNRKALLDYARQLADLSQSTAD